MTWILIILCLPIAPSSIVGFSGITRYVSRFLTVSLVSSDLQCVFKATDVYENGHATLIAQTIFSIANDVRMCSVKFLGKNGHGTEEAIVEALRYTAVAIEASGNLSVVSMSFTAD